jgi:hypothetical protein
VNSDTGPAVLDSELAELEADERKRLRRERRRLYDAGRTLDEWERYRALVDANDEAYEQIDVTNREARFALILMGALNAVVLVLLTRADAVSALSPTERYWVVGLFVGYVLTAIAFLLQAIEALRPGRFRPRLWDWTHGEESRPAGVRYYEDVIKKSASEHWQAWQGVRLVQLNAEMSVQLHSLSLKNHAKHLAIRRLYNGLRLMALVLGLLIVIFAWLVWT